MHGRGGRRAVQTPQTDVWRSCLFAQARGATPRPVTGCSIRQATRHSGVCLGVCRGERGRNEVGSSSGFVLRFSNLEFNLAMRDDALQRIRVEAVDRQQAKMPVSTGAAANAFRWREACRPDLERGAGQAARRRLEDWPPALPSVGQGDIFFRHPGRSAAAIGPALDRRGAGCRLPGLPDRGAEP